MPILVRKVPLFRHMHRNPSILSTAAFVALKLRLPGWAKIPSCTQGTNCHRHKYYEAREHATCTLTSIRYLRVPSPKMCGSRSQKSFRMRSHASSSMARGGACPFFNNRFDFLPDRSLVDTILTIPCPHDSACCAPFVVGPSTASEPELVSTNSLTDPDCPLYGFVTG